MPRHFSREFSKSFSIPKTTNGAAGYGEPMKLEVLTEIITRIYWH